METIMPHKVIDLRLFDEWKKISVELKEMKALELRARKMLCNDMFALAEKDVSDVEFKVKIVQEGKTVVAHSKTNTSVDESILSSMGGELTEQEQSCLRYKPSLIKAKYDKLPEDSLLHAACVTKSSTPTLTVEAVK